MFIDLSKHDHALIDSLTAALADIPEVRTAHLIAGPNDLVVHVAARNTRHLKDLALDQFTNRPGVTRIETSIIYESRERRVVCPI